MFNYSKGDLYRLCPHPFLVPLPNVQRAVSIGANGLTQASMTPTIYKCGLCGLIGDRCEPLQKA